MSVIASIIESRSGTTPERSRICERDARTTTTVASDDASSADLDAAEDLVAADPRREQERDDADAPSEGDERMALAGR